MYLHRLLIYLLVLREMILEPCPYIGFGENHLDILQKTFAIYRLRVLINECDSDFPLPD